MSNPRWFQLITAKKAMGKIGLTIPFLVGATSSFPFGKSITQEEAKRSLLVLLNSFIDQPAKLEKPLIYRCEDTLQPTVTCFPVTYGNSHAYNFSSTTQNRESFYVDHKLYPFESVPTMEEFADKLFEEVGDAICERCFSYAASSYVRFTENDKGLIEFSRTF